MQNVIASVAAGGITGGRAQALAALAVGLISVVIGWRARSVRRRAVMATALGALGAVLGGLHLATSTGFGTGGGRAGAIVAVVVALLGTTLGGLGLARPHRSS